MSFCLNLDCSQPQNPNHSQFCQTCGAQLLLKQRYRAIKSIGQGGFGKTFLGVDEDKPSKPPCVIKQFFPSSQGTNTLEKAEELFNQEAVRLDELGKHPQIPELYAHFKQDNYLYLIQEYIDGDNLAQTLQEGAWNESQIRELLISLLPVLEFIHEKTIIHRDIKPENIIQRRSDNAYFLVDFGAARYATGTALLKTGTIIGDPRYMSPEQLSGKTDFTSDLYCLGVTCLYLLTLVDPLQLFDISEDEWVWRDFLNNNSVSDELGKILDKMIIRATRKRFQSAQEVRQALTPSVLSSSPSPSSQKVDFNFPISTEYEVIDAIFEGLFLVKDNSYHQKCGVINQIGQVIIPVKYKAMEKMSDELLLVKDHSYYGKFGVINKTGQVIIPVKYQSIAEVSNGLFIVQDSRYYQKYGVINKKGQVIIPIEYESIAEVSNGLFIVKHSSYSPKYGVLDQTGQIIIPIKYSNIQPFSEQLFKAYLDYGWGIIDQKVKTILPFKFTEIHELQNELALVERYTKYPHKKYGWISEKGKIVIPCKFDFAHDFVNGCAYVEKKGLFGTRKGYIDKQGKWVD
jgi:hypothetical protein